MPRPRKIVDRKSKRPKQSGPSGQACAKKQPGQLQSGTLPNGCPRWVTPNINTGGSAPGGATKGAARQGARARKHGFLGEGQGWGDDQ